MIQINESDYLQIDLFNRSWRFTDVQWNELTSEELAKIRPLRPEKAAELHERSLALLGQYTSGTSDYELVARTRALWNEVPRVMGWLLDRIGNQEQKVVVSWDSTDAVLTDWDVFCNYWDDFCYPGSDDAAIWPLSEEWVLVYYHWEEIHLARPMNWHEHAREFEDDGLPTYTYSIPALVDWQKPLDYLRNRPYEFAFRVDPEVASLPEDAQRVFEMRKNAGTSLCVNLGGVLANCLLFT